MLFIIFENSFPFLHGPGHGFDLEGRVQNLPVGINLVDKCKVLSSTMVLIVLIHLLCKAMYIYR